MGTLKKVMQTNIWSKAKQIHAKKVWKTMQ